MSGVNRPLSIGMWAVRGASTGRPSVPAKIGRQPRRTVMRKLIYSMGVSLDGFIAGPDGEIDWSAPDEELHRFHNTQTRELGGHFLGRRLYETMVYWETADGNPSA